MKASYCKCTMDYLPVIIHNDGHKEKLHGPLLCNKFTAIKYAQIEINKRQRRDKF